MFQVAMLGDAEVSVDGDREAVFLRDTAKSELTLCICGECGHTDLQATSHRQLYEKYLRSLGRDEEARGWAAEGRALEEVTSCLKCDEPLAAGITRCPASAWTYVEGTAGST